MAARHPITRAALALLIFASASPGSALAANGKRGSAEKLDLAGLHATRAVAAAVRSHSRDDRRGNSLARLFAPGDRVVSVKVRSAPIDRASERINRLMHFVATTANGKTVNGLVAVSYTADFRYAKPWSGRRGAGFLTTFAANYFVARDGAHRVAEHLALPEGLQLPAKATRPSDQLIRKIKPLLRREPGVRIHPYRRRARLATKRPSTAHSAR